MQGPALWSPQDGRAEMSAAEAEAFNSGEPILHVRQPGGPRYKERQLPFAEEHASICFVFCDVGFLLRESITYWSYVFPGGLGKWRINELVGGGLTVPDLADLFHFVSFTIFVPPRNV